MREPERVVVRLDREPGVRLHGDADPRDVDVPEPDLVHHTVLGVIGRIELIEGAPHAVGRARVAGRERVLDPRLRRPRSARDDVPELRVRRAGPNSVAGVGPALADHVDRIVRRRRERADDPRADRMHVGVAEPRALARDERARLPVPVADELPVGHDPEHARVHAVEVLSVDVMVEPIVRGHDDGRDERVDGEARVRVTDLDGVERPRRIGPVRRADEPLIVVGELLTAGPDRPPALLGLANLDVALSEVEVVLMNGRVRVRVEGPGL